MRGHREAGGFGASGISRRDFLRRAGKVGLALGAAGSLGSLTACGGSQETEEPAPKGTKVSGDLTYVYFGGAEQRKLWQSIVDLFQEEYPDVRVKANGIAADSWSAFFDTVSVRIAGGQVPDVVRVATEGQRLFASRGVAMPIDEYIERDKDYIQGYYDDISPKLIEVNKKYSSPGENTYYLPGEFNPMCVWYSTELFQQAGVEEPNDDWTWDDFLAAAEELTKPGEVFGMHVPPAYFASLMPWLLTNGASTMNADWTESTVASPEAVESVRFMRSLVEEGISPKPGGEYDPFTAMSQGKLAMFGGGRWPIISMRNLDYVDKVKIVAWPQKEGKGSPLGWDGYAIMKESENKEAAWAFAKFMTTRKANERFAQLGGTEVPPRRSVAMSDAFLSNSPEGSKKLYEALDYATAIPSPNKGSVIEQDIIDTLTQILAGNAEPEEGLQQLDQKIQSNL